MMKNKFLISILSMLLLTALSGCSSSPIESAVCPSVKFVDGLDRMALFKDLVKSNPSKGLFSSQMRGLGVKCDFSRDGANIEASFQIVSRLADVKKQTMVEITYFVAAVDPGGRILAKETFNLNIPFSSKKAEIVQKQVVTPFFPKLLNSDFSGYKLLIGFQLSKSQVNSNLENRR
jgi:hypothetical protein